MDDQAWVLLVFPLKVGSVSCSFFYIVCIGIEVCCVWDHTGLLDR